MCSLEARQVVVGTGGSLVGPGLSPLSRPLGLTDLSPNQGGGGVTHSTKICTHLETTPWRFQGVASAPYEE